MPFFKVTERFPFGTEVTMKRRDLRKGKQTASASRAQDGAVRVQMAWGEPLAGAWG